MISQYSNPVDIDREFWADLERADEKIKQGYK